MVAQLPPLLVFTYTHFYSVGTNDQSKQCREQVRMTRNSTITDQPRAPGGKEKEHRQPRGRNNTIKVQLTLNTPITKSRLFSSSAEMFKKPLSMANSVNPDQTAPIGAVCSGSTLFAFILNSSVMLDNYLQQTTSADDIFRCIFSLAL